MAAQWRRSGGAVAAQRRRSGGAVTRSGVVLLLVARLADSVVREWQWQYVRVTIRPHLPTEEGGENEEEGRQVAEEGSEDLAGVWC